MSLVILINLDKIRFFIKFTEMNNQKIYDKIIEEIKKYFKANNLSRAVIGLSGGIDSAVTALLMRESIGENKIDCVFMPTEFTADNNKKDVYELCKNLKTPITELDINAIFDSYLTTLSEKFIIKKIEVPEENLQARIRANLLMYVANRENAIVIAPGNRSEILTGYCTLYGDTVGAIAPIGSLYKTQVYELAKWVNKNKDNPIPISIIKKAPSAELNKDQKDEDELLPYKILDSILKLYVDEHKSKEEIIKEGFRKEDIEKTIHLVEASNFKRIKLPVIIETR
ncbi:MAG: NAD(+) synthase [candidate division WOR-3 bacterium]